MRRIFVLVLATLMLCLSLAAARTGTVWADEPENPEDGESTSEPDTRDPVDPYTLPPEKDPFTP